MDWTSYNGNYGHIVGIPARVLERDEERRAIFMNHIAETALDPEMLMFGDEREAAKDKRTLIRRFGENWNRQLKCTVPSHIPLNFHRLSHLSAEPWSSLSDYPHPTTSVSFSSNTSSHDSNCPVKGGILLERLNEMLGRGSRSPTGTRVYFVMEYVSGGDLMLHIQREQFSLRQAKFYASEVLLALDLINMWYGSTTSTFCGTPEFMAPEILLEQRYGRAVDWWAFGVLTYEMLLGQSPFRGDDKDEIFDAILEDEPLYPITMPRDAVSILQQLLAHDPTRHLGSGKADAKEIRVKRHPFFKDVSFDDVLNKHIPPLYFSTIVNPDVLRKGNNVDFICFFSIDWLKFTAS
ncbi:kinase-like domain-containing protein [Suillus discolor]|uniref:Kinase-like domain-containing protein n=1 Tax=Suillus discolor TaxID=1912936 RepID=A0A9P7FGA7_9AGAM|nr:kinase-like domain-containing protein [Suillus discolor]KAG2115097.1 kinase-like domain-containing protein [Suillus discolor]